MTKDDLPQGSDRGAKTVVTDKAVWAQYMRDKRSEWKRRKLARAAATSGDSDDKSDT